MSGFGTAIALSPLFPWPLTWVLLGLAFFATALAVFTRARGAAWRALMFAALVLVLLNPALVEEERSPRKDVAVVVVDQSRSQSIGERRGQAEQALAQIDSALAGFDDLEVRILRVPEPGAGPSAAGGLPRDGTYLFDALSQALADVPRRRVAGAVMITDGEVHDAPKDLRRLPLDAPLHVLLTGERGERDRRLAVEQAPRFGLVGQNLKVTLKVDDGAGASGSAKLTIRRDEGSTVTADFPAGGAQAIELPIDHPGENVFEIEAEPGPDELTLENNRVVIAVNGVRDRLRVLLVSGEPYPGERVWRNLLKSDPAVDLIHFTILRPPEKLDLTPVRELSLIAFPIEELFEVKLKEFDLVIFDHYKRRGLLPPEYYDNIVNYVKDGGALLEVAGPDFSNEFSLYRTSLAGILPGAPTGETVERGFRPAVTETGRRHPVTAELTGAEGAAPAWGRWFRQIDAEAKQGEVVLDGVNTRPILILDRFGKGRVAQLLSDQIWLWSRGFEGGGPHAELVRRLAHWLMKEPELEENALVASVQGNRMEITRRSLERAESPVTVTAPSGASRAVPLGPEDRGRARAEIAVDEPGLYRLGDGVRSTVAAVGALQPMEMAEVRATDEKLKDVAAATSGGIVWLAGKPEIDAKRISRGRSAFGGTEKSPWLGFVANRDYAVTGVHETPLVPAAALLLAALGALALAWRREGM
jgi:hypothetical protein